MIMMKQEACTIQYIQWWTRTLYCTHLMATRQYDGINRIVHTYQTQFSISIIKRRAWLEHWLDLTRLYKNFTHFVANSNFKRYLKINAQKLIIFSISKFIITKNNTIYVIYWTWLFQALPQQKLRHTCIDCMTHL